MIRFKQLLINAQSLDEDFNSLYSSLEIRFRMKVWCQRTGMNLSILTDIKLINFPMITTTERFKKTIIFTISGLKIDRTGCSVAI